MTKKTKKEVSPENEQKKIQKKRSSKYSKTKGSRYEQQIAKELRDLGFTGCVTARSESKSTDDNKIDIVDKDGKLPFNIQLKKTLVAPQYFKIREESTVNPESFVLF